MKVICAKPPPSPTGQVLEVNPWVTVGVEYQVVSVSAVPGRRVMLQIVTDDGRTLGLFDSSSFKTIDSSIPERWRADIDERGILRLAPDAWLARGFWEAYYDGDPAAIEAVNFELQRQ